MTSQLVNKQLQYTNLPVSQEVKSIGNQAMKFHRLVGYNMRNIFLEKLYTRWDTETIPRPFFKKTKLSISLDQFSKVL